ncbi:MAG: peptidoglycan-binding protein [Myxococcales bacterium]|nr:peptidoglycan-binding protein [Myxococcales bacterium]
MSVMKPYVIRRGDYLLKLAHQLGFDADKVWKDGANADLRALRDDPDMLQAGDILMIPDEPKKELPLRAEQDNAFVAKVPKISVSLAVTDDDEPLANEAYVVEGLGDDEERTTDGDGFVSFEAPVHVREVTVKFLNVDLAFRIGIGELDPIDTPSGLRKRLTQLGFYGAKLQGADRYQGRTDAAMAAAIAAFQKAQGLEVTGELDDGTRDKIVEVHGS